MSVEILDEEYLVGPDNLFNSANRASARMAMYVSRSVAARADAALETNSVRFNIDDYVIVDGAVVNASYHPVTLKLSVSADKSDDETEEALDPLTVSFDCTSRWVAGHGYAAGRWSKLHGDERVEFLSKYRVGSTVPEIVPEFLDDENFAIWDHIAYEWRPMAALMFDGDDAMFTNTTGWVSDTGIAAMAAFVLRPPEDDDDQSYLVGFLPRGSGGTNGMFVSLDSGGRLSLRVGDQLSPGSADSVREVVGVNVSDSYFEPIIVGIRLVTLPGGREKAVLFVRSKSINKSLSKTVTSWSTEADTVAQKLASCVVGLLYSEDEDRTAVLDATVWLSGVDDELFAEAADVLAHCYGVA